MIQTILLIMMKRNMFLGHGEPWLNIIFAIFGFGLECEGLT